MEKLNYFYFLLTALICCNFQSTSCWDFAVSTKGQILFYTSDWNQITSAAHQFDELSAIAVDETHEVLYFNDQSHANGTIFSLKLSSDDNHRTEKVLTKTKNEWIQGMAFDPLERKLYWTDAKSRMIFQLDVDNRDDSPSVFMKFDDTKIPHGISVDVCRRKIYWTNSNHRNASIERASLDGSKHEVIVDKKDLYMPSGIVVDQFSKRIYWVDDLEGDHYTVKSAALDGTERVVITQRLYNEPVELAVDRTNIYWTDTQHNAIWSLPKDNKKDEEPKAVKNFTEDPKGIIARDHFLSTQAENADCKTVLSALKKVLDDGSMTPTKPLPSEEKRIICLNGGTVNPAGNSCICPREFKGANCEISLCYNYCVEGTCRFSSTGLTQCECFDGFEGERCEVNKCHGFCLNGGHCNIENQSPTCHCLTGFYGRHCESMDKKLLCKKYCSNESDVDIDVMDLMVTCQNCSNSINNTALHPSNQLGIGQTMSDIDALSVCRGSTINKTAIFVSLGVVVSLALVLIIVHSVRHIYKPMRPRIKKTYVVHKNVTPTPMTCRPTTEQCEITIENCCNMNICDTPCFDPTTMQAEAAKKDDKKTLLNHTDSDLMF